MSVNAAFIVTTSALAMAAVYWLARPGGRSRIGGTAVVMLLASAALAFAAYTPVVSKALDAMFPQLSVLLSNCCSMAAGTSSVVLLFHVNLDAAQARRRIRLRLRLFAIFVSTMTALFVWEELSGGSTHLYAAYLAFFVSYLAFALADFLRQAVHQSTSARHRSTRWGLRIASMGCVSGLVYAAYKSAVLVSFGFDLHLVTEDRHCSSLVKPPCSLGVSAPALAVLLIGIGLTCPAAAYPIRQLRRRRWEIRSLAALEPLWSDLTAVMPEIVLPTEESAGKTHDYAFLLQRRVIEISDGLLTLRPYHRPDVLAAIHSTVDSSTKYGAAVAEAAATRAALADLRSGLQPAEGAGVPHPSAAFPRAGDLRSEAEWLVAVADAYALGPKLPLPVNERTESVGA